MNINDVATEVEERHREEALAAHRARTASQPILRPTGHCIWCGESLQNNDNPRFCDAEHRNEYDRYVARHPERFRTK